MNKNGIETDSIFEIPFRSKMSNPEKDNKETKSAIKREKSEQFETKIPAINGTNTLIAGYLIK
ncbi:MAG: hypothetical protein GW823_07290 [Bacteroidetes bacterium]|nr:hypothetical protein [Bacteroidota bacterium]